MSRLVQHDASMHTFIDALSGAVLLTDSAGRLCHINAAARQFFELGANTPATLDSMFADDGEAVGLLTTAARDLADGRVRAVGIDVIGTRLRGQATAGLRFDGAVVGAPGAAPHILWSVRGCDDEPGSAARVAGDADQADANPLLQALERSEHRYRQLIEHIPDIAWTASANGAKVFVSSCVEKILGYTPDEIYAMREHACRLLVHPEDASAVVAAHRRLFEGGGYSIECRMRHRDGHYIWILDRATSTYEIDGAPFADGLCSDITERKQAQEALRRAHDLLLQRVEERTAEAEALMASLEQAKSSQERFVAAASHDLRTPLTVVRAELDLLRQTGKHDDSTRIALERIDQESRRLDRLASDLLLLATLDALNPTEPVAPHRPGDLLLLCVAGANARGAAKGLLWDVRCDDVPSLVCAPQALRHAITNVLNNAVEHSSECGLIHVRLHADDGAVIILVRDEGEGIAEADLPRIFDRFFRSDSARSTPGTGLGLAIVKAVVELHNGSVDVRSIPGSGTEVTLRLPL